MSDCYEVITEDGSRRTVRFTGSAGEVSDLFRKVRKSIARDLSMPGFRPGRIPDAIVDRKFGNLIVAEVADRMRQDLTSRLLTEKDWILGDEDPEGEYGLPVDGQEYSFELTFTLFETPEPRGYEGIEIRIPPFDVEKALESALQSFRERMVSFRPVDRPAADGDLVVLATVPSGDGESEPREISVRLGDDQLGPGFDDLVRGASAGFAFRARMEDGREGGDPPPVHDFTVSEVREALLPELDDELARTVADVETLDEFRKRIRENIEKRRRDEVDYLSERSALDTLLEANPFDPPDYMVDNLSADFMSRLDDKEPSPETRDAVREMALKKVREFLLLRAIAAREGIEVPFEEAAREKSAEESASSASDRLRNRKAVEHVIAHATILEEDQVHPEPDQDDTGSGPGWRWARVPDRAEPDGEPGQAGNTEG